MTVAPRFAFDNSYARLPERFFARQAPAPAPSPALLALNVPLARDLGLDPDALGGASGVAILSGAAVPDGATPLAMAYAGHQFGSFVPQLGDGRAVLLGEVIRPDGARRDIQLKGAGRTPFSRMGDGKATLGPVLREFLVSEAMHALGIRTTRALAAVSTGEQVMRDDSLPGAVLTRVARSHIRVGTFQYFAARQDRDGLEALTAYALARHYPGAEAATPATALLDGVIAAQATLIASWLSVGFIHGVMNTDNMSIAGETIDFGPCAFLDGYEAAKVYSSIDRQGRYAFGAQPRAAHWNLLQLAQALLPLLGETEDEAVAAAQASLDRFPNLYEAAWLGALRAKMGLTGAQAGDAALGADLLTAMEGGGADFTLTFRGLSGLSGVIPGAGPATDGPARDQFIDPTAFDAWAVRWRARLAEAPRPDADRQAAMRAVNPAVIPRNHMVEHALSAAHLGDMAPFEAIRAALATPFDDHPEAPRLSAPPLAAEEVRHTFCGT
jgi:uncharacterized protein YdiU (UPF0061 family)